MEADLLGRYTGTLSIGVLAGRLGLPDRHFGRGIAVG